MEVFGASGEIRTLMPFAQPPQGCVYSSSTTDAKNRRDPAVCKARIAVVAQLTGLEPAVSWFVAMCSHPIELQLH